MVDDTPLDDTQPTNRRAHSELVKRVVSGLLFASLAIGLAWAGKGPFALLVILVALVMSWEWARIVRGGALDMTLAVHVLAVAAASILAMCGYAALGVAVLAVGAILAVPLQFGDRPILSALGVLYTGLPAVAMLWLRGDNATGFRAILLVLLVTWASDIGAYASGRVIGGPKLAPGISPNKTWSGLTGGIAASALTAGVFALSAGAAPAPLVIAGLAMGLIAQAGDLAESALKRTFGVKDASSLLPGHGGFMDRMDGIVAVAVAVGLFALFASPHAPAEALVPRVWP